MNSTTKKLSMRVWGSCVAAAAFLTMAGAVSAEPVCEYGCGESPEAPVDCSAGCTRNVFGWAGVNVNADEVVCVQPGRFLFGGVNMNGGELRVCGAAYPRYFNANTADVNVLGTLRTANINMNGTDSHLMNYGTLNVGTLNFQSVFENHGDATIRSGGLNVNWGAVFVNSGDIDINGNVNDVGLFINWGRMLIDGSVNLNNGDFTNSCETDITGDLNVSRAAVNAGSLNVDGTITLNQSLALAPGAVTETSNLMVNAPVYGPEDVCASIKIDHNTTINSNGPVSGLVDICDANGIEVQNGPLEDTVTTDCSCTVCDDLPPVI